jgi:hypothetical protein
MAVAYDTAVDAIELGGDGVLSLSITATGSDRAAFVGSAHSHSSSSINGATTFGGGATTELWDYQCDASALGDNKNRTAGYSYVAPPTTSTTVTNTLDSAPAYWQVIGCITLTGVDQVTPCGTAVTAEGASNTPSVTVTDAVSGDMVVDCLSTIYESSGVSETAGANQTSRCSERPDAQDCWGMSSQAGADGGVMSWTLGSSFSPYWGLGAVAFKQVVASQYAYPTTDTTRDNWEEDDGTTTTIYDQIDETTADDADYIRTQTAPSSDVYVTKFGSLTDPSSSANHTLSLRYGKDSAAGDNIGLVAQLRQGYASEASLGTLIATALNNTNIGSGWTQADYTLSGAEADTISNYGDLYLRLVGNQEVVGYSTTPPTYRGAGGTGIQSGTTSATITAVTSNAENDVLLIVLESSDSSTAAGTPNTPSGWTKIFERTEGGGATNVTTLTIFARLAPAGGSGNVTVDGVGDHCGGRMFAITTGTHSVTSVATDIKVGSGTGHGTGTTDLVTGELSGLVANSRIFWCIGLSDDAADTTNASGYTNANLASITEITDQTVSTGAGGGIAVAHATCAGTTTGASGNWDHDTAVQSQSVYVAIPPVKAPRRAQVSWARFRTPQASAASINAQPGTFTLTGIAATLAAGKLFDAQPGTFNLTGIAATLAKGYSFEASPGSFALTGTAATFVRSVLLDAATGSLTLTGVAATIVAAHHIDASPGSFTLNGIDATFAKGYAFDAATGSFTLSGIDATLTAGRLFDAQPGTFTLNGVAATLLAARPFEASPGTFTLGGVAATFLADRMLNAEPGVFTFTGIAATLVPPGLFIDAQPGSFAFTGVDAGLVYSGAAAAATRLKMLTGVGL